MRMNVVSRFRCTLAALAGLCSLACSAHAQNFTTWRGLGGSGVVEGNVTTSDGRPAARAIVLFTIFNGPVGARMFQLVADRYGWYSFGGVPTGVYYVSPVAAARGPSGREGAITMVTVVPRSRIRNNIRMRAGR